MSDDTGSNNGNDGQGSDGGDGHGAATPDPAAPASGRIAADD